MTKRQIIFLVGFWTMFACWIIGLFISDVQMNLFYDRGGDLFADFFNNLRYVAGRDPYFDMTNGSLEHVYPPLCYMFFYPFAFLCGRWGGIDLPNAGLSAFWHSPLAMASCILVMSVALGLFAWAVWHILGTQPSRTTKWLLLGSFFASGIVLFSFERGNLILPAAAGIACFLALKGRPLTGGTGLAVAAAMKIYPAAFLVEALKKKEFKKSIWIALAVAVLGFAPLLLFRHSPIENAFQLLSNVKLHEEAYFVACPPNLTLASYVAAGAQSLKLAGEAWMVSVAKMMSFAIGVASCTCIWFQSESWKRWFLAATAIALCSSMALYYTLLYFLPAIYKYLASGKRAEFSDWFYAIAFCVMLMPFQLGDNLRWCGRHDTINSLVATCLIHSVSLLILLQFLLKQKCSPHRLQCARNR